MFVCACVYIWVRSCVHERVRAYGCVTVCVYEYLNDRALSHSISLSLSLFISLSLPFPLAVSFSPFFFSLSLSFSLCIFHSLSLCLSLSISIFVSLSPSFSLSQSVTVFLSLSRTLWHTTIHTLVHVCVCVRERERLVCVWIRRRTSSDWCLKSGLPGFIFQQLAHTHARGWIWTHKTHTKKYPHTLSLSHTDKACGTPTGGTNQLDFWCWVFLCTVPQNLVSWYTVVTQKVLWYTVLHRVV